MTQAFYDGFPWKIYRGRGGWPRWWQRFHEAWLVVTGRYTFWHAWHDGKHRGSADEFQRIVANGGDMGPLIDAAIYAISARTMNGSEPQAEFMPELRRLVWQRYERDRSAMVSALPRPQRQP